MDVFEVRTYGSGEFEAAVKWIHTFLRRSGKPTRLGTNPWWMGRTSPLFRLLTAHSNFLPVLWPNSTTPTSRRMARHTRFRCPLILSDETKTTAACILTISDKSTTWRYPL